MSEDGIFLWSGTGLLFAGALLAAWALLADRSRGRRRCPRCWYDFTGISGLTCPECGRTSPVERALHRTRRRWRWAAAAAVLAGAGCALHRGPDVRARGWPGLIPTTLLIVLAPVDESSCSWTHVFEAFSFPQPTTPLLREALVRLEADRMAGWQSQFFLDRLFRASPDQLNQLLETFDLWPENEEIIGRLGWVVFYAPDEDGTLIRARARGETSWQEICGGARVTPHGLADDFLFRVPSRSSGVVDIELELWRGASVAHHAFRVTSVDPSTARRVWRGTRQIRVQGTPEEALEPVRSAEADAAVRSLRPHLIWTRERTVALTMINEVIVSGLTPHTTLATRCEVLRNGEIVATGPVHYPITRHVYLSSTLNQRIEFPLTWTGPLPTHPDWRNERWEIRLTGDARLALADFPRRQYWAGSITVPVERLLWWKG